MINRRISAAFAIVATLAIISATGCAKKPKPEESAVPNTESALDNALGDSDSGKAMGMQTVYFPFDSFNLDSTAKGVLKANSEIMKANGSVKVQIEGHTDARGGIQYNIALGEKRANAVKAYLTDLGVSGDRVTTVSFGKERMVDQGSTEEAHSKNRRANFVITSR